MSAWTIFFLWLVMFLLGTPLFVCLGIATVLCLKYLADPAVEPVMFVQQMFSLADKDALMAIPFFVLASTLATTGASARRIVGFIESLVEWLPGGMALAAVASCIFFAAMCGLSPAAVVAVGTIMYPGLVASGYPRRFSLGLVTSAGSLGILIPPSLVMIVLCVAASGAMQDYKIAEAMRTAEKPARAAQTSPARPGGPQTAQADDAINNEELIPAWAGADPANQGEQAPAATGSSPATTASVATPQLKPAQAARPFKDITFANLFTAGALPALLIAGLFCAFSVITGMRARVKRSPFRSGEAAKRLFLGLPSLALPALIIAGIFSGKLTVLQAAAAAAVYMLALEVLILRAVPLKKLPGIFRETGSVTGMILIILAATFAFNWFLTSEGIPAQVTDLINAHFHSKLVFLLAVNLLFLFMGCIMDILSAIFITIPLLLPAAMSLGVDPVHFCVMFVVNFEIGYLTPPVGINLFTAGAVFKRGLVEVSRSVLPFLALLLLALAAVTYFPALSLWLVK